MYTFRLEPKTLSTLKKVIFEKEVISTYIPPEFQMNRHGSFYPGINDKAYERLRLVILQ